MISTCIRHPERHPLLIIREWQIKFCDGNHCAAALLSFFEHWHNVRLDMQIKAAQANRIAQNHGQEGNQDDSLYQFHNAEEIERGLLGLYRRDAIRQARKLLVKKGAISEHGNPSERYKFDKTTYFIFYPEICQRFIDEYYSEAHSSTYAENRTSSAKNRNSPPENRNSLPENRTSINKITTETTTDIGGGADAHAPARVNDPDPIVNPEPADPPSGQQEGQSSASHSPADPPFDTTDPDGIDLDRLTGKKAPQKPLDPEIAALVMVVQKSGVVPRSKFVEQATPIKLKCEQWHQEGVTADELSELIAAHCAEQAERGDPIRSINWFDGPVNRLIQAKKNPVGATHTGPGSNSSKNSSNGEHYGTHQANHQPRYANRTDHILSMLIDDACRGTVYEHWQED